MQPPAGFGDALFFLAAGPLEIEESMPAAGHDEFRIELQCLPEFGSGPHAVVFEEQSGTRKRIMAGGGTGIELDRARGGRHCVASGL